MTGLEALGLDTVATRDYDLKKIHHSHNGYRLFGTIVHVSTY